MERARDREDGLTLIELLIVFVIIAALIAMSFPSYLGARSRATERAAQTDARNAFETERLLMASTGEVSSDVATTLPSAEPTFNWLADAVPSNAVRKTVVVSVGTTSIGNDTIVLGTKAKNGVCFYIRNYVGAPVQYGTDASCASATNTLVGGAGPAGGWQSAW